MKIPTPSSNLASVRVKDDIPMVPFLLNFGILSVLYKLPRRKETHSIDIPRPSLILRSIITPPIRDTSKMAGDIIIQPRGQTHIKFIAIPMRVRATRVPRFSAARDGDIAATSPLERNSAVDGLLTDLLE